MACLAPLKKEGMIVVLVSLMVTQGFGEVGVGVFQTQKQMWALGDRKVRECSLLMKTEEDRWFGDE